MAANPCSRCSGPLLEAEVMLRPYWLDPLPGEILQPPDIPEVCWWKRFLRHTCYNCGHTYWSVAFHAVKRGQ
jgi:hypothetical protein